MYNARFILWPPSFSSPCWNMGRERRWPLWIKKALHIGIKRLLAVRFKPRPQAVRLGIKMIVPREQSSWGQHGAHLGPVGPRWAPCWPHEPCYQGIARELDDRRLGKTSYSLVNRTQGAMNLWNSFHALCVGVYRKVPQRKPSSRTRL